MTFVGLNAIDLDVGDGGVFASLGKVLAEVDVFDKEGTVVTVVGVLLGIPIAVDTNSHADGIDFLSHSF